MPCRSFSALLIFVCTVTGPVLAQQAAPELLSALQNGGRARVIVALRPPIIPLSETGGNISSYIQAVGENQDRLLGGMDKREFQLLKRWQTVSAFQAEVTYGGVIKLLANPSVLRIDQDVSGEAFLAQSVPLIGADQVASLGYDGTGTTVAVIDTGVSSTHPDLSGKIVDEYCYCIWDSQGCCPNGSTEQSGTGAAEDDHGHGTHVAGIIASSGTQAPPGVAPGVDIVAIKILNSQGGFWETAQIVTALDWIAVHHPDIAAVNLSVGTYASFDGYCDGATAWTIALADAIDNLTSLGVAVFAASGNSSSYTNLSAPACLQNAISVGAVYDAAFGLYNGEDSAPDKVVYFSNSNQTLDLLAPGCSIISAGLGTPTATKCGTSMACPHAAGAAALLRGADPSLTVGDIEDLLETTGLLVVDSRNGLSVPRIDVEGAFEELEIPLTPLSPDEGELFTSCSPAPVFAWKPGDYKSYTLTFSLNSSFLAPNTVFSNIKKSTWTPNSSQFPKKVFQAALGIQEPVDVFWRVTGVKGKTKDNGPSSSITLAPQETPEWLTPEAGTVIQASSASPLPPFTFLRGTCNLSAQIEFFTNPGVRSALKLPSKGVKAEGWTPSKSDQKKFIAWAKKVAAAGAPLYGRLLVKDNLNRPIYGDTVALQLIP